MLDKEKCPECGGKMFKSKGGYLHCSDLTCTGSITPEGEAINRPYAMADMLGRQERLANE